MKKISIYILAVVGLCAASCVSIEDGFIPADKSNIVSLMASVSDFSSINVGTKALEEEESKINELTMLIFDSEGTIVGRPINLRGGSSVFMIDTENARLIEGDEAIKMIENPADWDQESDYRFSSEYQQKLNSCAIYMVANCWHVLENKTITVLADLLSTDIPVEKIGIPANGIPMMGVESGFDLSSDRPTTASTVVDIAMDKLFAKINVRFQINAKQVVGTPTFNLKSWKVKNIPTAVRLENPAAGAETANASGSIFNSDPSKVLSHGVTTIAHSESTTDPDYLQFTFYVPEHKVNPTNVANVKYPANIPEDEKQRYKPLLCSTSQKPMHVTVEGSYTDHHGQVKEVTYSLYLGEDNKENFYIKRNQEHTNVITIKGLTNSVDSKIDGAEDNISVDHRVDITSDLGYSIAVEREALLDSHFEVRPMDVIVSAGGKVDLIVNGDWLRIEKSYGGNANNNNQENSTYIQNVGVRKYFTTDLVTNTLAATGTSVTITSEENPRVWLYFDENTSEPYDKTVSGSQKYRDISVTVNYYNAEAVANNSTNPTNTQTFTFRQINLWRVRNADNTRYYDIEYHEEYLYNYVSDNNYGKTKDGMAWGLDGLPLSDTYPAFAYTSKYSGENGFIKAISDIVASVIDSSIEDKPFYDFYVNSTEAGRGGTARSYSGKDFSNEIMEKVIFEISDNQNYMSTGQLNDDPKSAVEYCYSKNKRNSDGDIITKSTSTNIFGNVSVSYNTSKVNWFLPSIDQIEEIVVSGYSDFEVFQNKYYWASQPAYVPVDYTVTGKLWVLVTTLDIPISGQLYFDDVTRARSTKVEMVNGIPQYVTSGTTNAEEKWNLDKKIDSDGDGELDDYYKEPTGKSFQYDYGNKLRIDNKQRVRCVYRTGNVSDL